jgi:hypothetical protein
MQLIALSMNLDLLTNATVVDDAYILIVERASSTILFLGCFSTHNPHHAL